MTREEALEWFKDRKKMNLDDKCQQAEDMAIKALSKPNVIETLQELRAEIDREGDYYDTNVDTDIAKGLYKAVQIIDRKISEVQND